MIIVMDQILENIKKVNAGYNMGNHVIKVLCYVDDVILLAENKDDVGRLLYKMEITSQKFNMRISVGEAQSMVISKDPIRYKLLVDKK